MTIIVCGSAMSVMTGILSGTSPMRGRGPRQPTIGVVRPSAKQAGSGVSANPDLGRVHVSEGVVYEGEGDEC